MYPDEFELYNTIRLRISFFCFTIFKNERLTLTIRFID